MSTISPPFCHVLTKTTQLEDRQKTYATKYEKIEKEGNTKQFNSIGNRDSSPYEEQRLKTSFSPYKNRKNKTSFGENFGGGENKDT